MLSVTLAALLAALLTDLCSPRTLEDVLFASKKEMSSCGYGINEDECGDFFESDIIFPNLQRDPYLRNSFGPDNVRVVTDSELIWPRAIVPYMFDPGNPFTRKERDMVESAIQMFKKFTCVRWIPKSSEADYVVFTRQPGCYSAVGRQGGAQSLNVGKRCTEKLGIVLHEMMHALGFWHEQSRFDRDNYVSIIYQNIIDGREHNFEKNRLQDTQNIAPYDYTSLMHYSENAMSRNDKATIVPMVTDQRLGQRTMFSEIDLFEIRCMYRCAGTDCKKMPPHIRPLPEPQDRLAEIPFNCNFDYGFCNYYQEMYKDQVDWVRSIRGTPSDLTGPSGDRRSGGVYLFMEASNPAVYKGWHSENGKLTVTQIPIQPGGAASGIFMRNKNQGNDWFRAEINSNFKGTLRLGFEAQVGLGYRSDIAIDDISIRHKTCDIPAPTVAPPRDALSTLEIVGIAGGATAAIAAVIVAAVKFPHAHSLL